MISVIELLESPEGVLLIKTPRVLLDRILRERGIDIHFHVRLLIYPSRDVQEHALLRLSPLLQIMLKTFRVLGPCFGRQLA